MKWTITTDASEYRESLAIEKAIQENSQARENCLNHQLELEINPESFDFRDYQSRKSKIRKNKSLLYNFRRVQRRLYEAYRQYVSIHVS